jgi:hypothetical protein
MSILSSFSARTAHAPAAVFARWADPRGWPQWDPEVREVRFGPRVEAGARGWMRPAAGPPTTFAVTAYETDRVFTNASRMAGATLTFEHVVTPVPRGAQVSVQVRIDGPLAPFWRRVVGRSLADAARSSVSGLLSHLDSA